MKNPYKNSSVTVQFPSIRSFFNHVETKADGLIQQNKDGPYKQNHDNHTAGLVIEKPLWIKNSGERRFKFFSSTSNKRLGIKFVNYFGGQIVSINLL